MYFVCGVCVFVFVFVCLLFVFVFVFVCQFVCFFLFRFIISFVCAECDKYQKCLGALKLYNDDRPLSPFLSCDPGGALMVILLKPVPESIPITQIPNP